MIPFRLDVDAVGARRARAVARAAAGGGVPRAAAAGAGATLDDESTATLLLASDVATDDLLGLARARRAAGGFRFETFSPLYLTNECDAECRMCGMRRTNADLVRETADTGTIESQLDILHRRGLRAVAILTGEYRRGAARRAMIERTAATLRAALARGFRHVLINIGALDDAEYPVLLDGVPREADGRVTPQVTMCTFQEAYDPRVYARFMGVNGDNPRSDYRRRLENFDRAADAGVWGGNPLRLPGVPPQRGWGGRAAPRPRAPPRGGPTVPAAVASPRLGRASGTAYPAGVDDETLC